MRRINTKKYVRTTNMNKKQGKDIEWTKGKESERERERKRERQTDRQADRQRHREREGDEL